MDGPVRRREMCDDTSPPVMRGGRHHGPIHEQPERSPLGLSAAELRSPTVAVDLALVVLVTTAHHVPGDVIVVHAAPRMRAHGGGSVSPVARHGPGGSGSDRVSKLPCSPSRLTLALAVR